MAYFSKPIYATFDGFKKKSSNGAISSMSIPTIGTKKNVVVWGGGRGGEVLRLSAMDATGIQLAKTRLLGVEKGHAKDPDGDDQWFMLYEVEALAEGTGTLTAQDKAGMPFARIAFVVGAGGTRALIIVPSQGHHTGAFLSVALTLKSDVYKGCATIVRSKISKGCNFYFVNLDGTPYPIGSETNLSTVIIISHGLKDGPNLAFFANDPDLPLDDRQPLKLDGTPESANAVAFWRAVGYALNGAGKLVLMGCDQAAFAPKIVSTVNRRIYAQHDDSGAGAVDYTLCHVKAIEKGGTVPPMIITYPY